MASGKNLEIITIGNELLLGRASEKHLAYLASSLHSRGLRIRRSVVVSDDPNEIEAEVRRSRERADLVLTTGGLGPTSDDRTREAVARALGVALRRDEETVRRMEDFFRARGRSMTPNNLRQADRPEGADLIANHRGTAPGIWYQKDGKILIMLPGPADELHPMFENDILPRLDSAGILEEEAPHVEIRTAGMGESLIETTLEPLLKRYPGLNIGYRAHSALVDVRLSSEDGAYPREALMTIAEECAEALGEDFVGYGCQMLSKIISDRLRERDQLLAVAESCTGGLLASCFTDIPGASKTFAGGVVAYTNAAKVQLLNVPECLLAQHGAVSPEAAVAMATGAAERLSAEYALSITGYAGPGGGDLENPVGTIHLGLHTPEGVWSRRVNFPGNRTTIKTRAVNAALDWLRRQLAKPLPATSSAG